MTEPDNFPELLRTYRRSKGWTQEKMAKALGFSSETISAWERGKRVPSGQEIPGLAERLSMKAEELVSYIDTTRVRMDVGKNHEGEVDSARPERESERLADPRNELVHIYRDRTELGRDYSYPRLFEKAHDILAVGISLNAIAMTYSKENIMKLITEQKCTITLCFLQPEGIGCTQREREEGLPTGWLSSLIRLNLSNMQNILNHIQKTAPDCAQQLHIMTYDLLPRYNIYVVDDAFMTMQSYAFERGEDTPTFVFQRQSSRGLFDFFAATARYIREHASSATNPPDETINEIEA